MQLEDGPIDKPKTVEEVRQEPYTLPDRCACMHGAMRVHMRHATHLQAAKQPARQRQREALNTQTVRKADTVCCAWWHSRHMHGRSLPQHGRSAKTFDMHALLLLAASSGARATCQMTKQSMRCGCCLQLICARCMLSFVGQGHASE